MVTAVHRYYILARYVQYPHALINNPLHPVSEKQMAGKVIMTSVEIGATDLEH
jgi:hypothetical protein